MSDVKARLLERLTNIQGHAIDGGWAGCEKEVELVQEYIAWVKAQPDDRDPVTYRPYRVEMDKVSRADFFNNPPTT